MINPKIQGFKTLLLGTPGSGKTKAIETLLETDLEVFCIFTEPMDTISAAARHNPKFHYVYIPASNPGFSALLDSAKKINQMNQKMLANLTDISKTSYGQFITVLESLSNFKDQHGQTYGSVEQWDNSRVLVIDSLSGMNIMAMDLVVGGKPVKSQADWGIAMDNLERLINQLTTGVVCNFVLSGHIDMDKDELSGRMVHTCSTLGKKLAPKLPRFFSDVVKAYREGNNFHWSTADSMIDLKFRLLPNSDKLKPSFVQLYNEWKVRAEAENKETIEQAQPQQTPS